MEINYKEQRQYVAEQCIPERSYWDLACLEWYFPNTMFPPVCPLYHVQLYIPSLMILTLFTTLNILGPGETIEKMRSERSAQTPRKYSITGTTIMDHKTIKTPNPHCRLYCCLIEFVDWIYSQSWWYFRPIFWTSAPLTLSLVHLHPPPPFQVRISTGICIHTVCNGGGGLGCVESIKRHINTYRQIPLLVNF
jgi:hypothetical protein